MNDVPHNDESSDDIDDLYRRAAAQDPSRPSGRVRQAVLEQAAQLAPHRTLDRPNSPHKAKTFFPPRRIAVLGTLTAAVLVGLVVAPRFLLTPSPSSPEPPVKIARIGAPVASVAPAAPVASVAPAAPVASSASGSMPATRATTAASATKPAPAAAPVHQAPGATTLVNALSADGAAAGATSGDQLYAADPAPDSPLVGAAVRRAAEQGDVARLQYLLDRGADINARDADDRSPLMLAVIHGRMNIVELLLTHGANANAADHSGTTPLQAADSMHQTAIAAALRSAGAH